MRHIPDPFEESSSPLGHSIIFQLADDKTSHQSRQSPSQFCRRRSFQFPPPDARPLSLDRSMKNHSNAIVHAPYGPMSLVLSPKRTCYNFQQQQDGGGWRSERHEGIMKTNQSNQKRGRQKKKRKEKSNNPIRRSSSNNLGQAMSLGDRKARP